MTITLRSILLPLYAATLPACLGPRVDDTPGASTHLLPSGARVPRVTDNVELTNQIALNDGIDDRALESDGVLARGTGVSAGAAVRYWQLGSATRAPSPIYVFYGPDGAPLTAHPPLVDAVPGDPGYSPLHAVNKVELGERYRGQRITTHEALVDAIDLGLAEDPEPDGTFIHTPIVLPETAIETGPGTSAQPEIIYARGYEVGMFRFGGDRGVQPASQLVPTLQVSFLRAARGARYDTSRPIFQATVPPAPAGDDVTYTPLSVVINVDLADGVDPAEITEDSQLFVRSATGTITSTTEAVARFEIEPVLQVLQLQFAEGSL